MATSVYIGKDKSDPLFLFEDNDLMSVSVDTSVSLVLDEMASDTAEITVLYDDANKELQNLLWGTPVYIDEGAVPIGKFLLKRVSRVGEKTYKLECTSLVGLLDYGTYYGGMFSGELFQDVVENIITTNGMTHLLGASPVVRRALTDEENPSFAPTFHDAGVSIIPGGLGIYFRVTVTVNRSLLSEVDVPSLENATTCRDVIWGTACDSSLTASATTRQRCGLYMDITRASTSDPWPNYGEVFFAVGSYVESLGTPTAPTTYRVELMGNVVRVNGRTNNITTTPNVSTDWYQNFLGGLLITNDNLDTVSGSYPHDVVYSRYEILSSVEQCYFDGIVYKTKSGQLIPGSGADGSYTEETAIPNAIPTAYVSFQTEEEYQSEMLSTIQYADGIESLPVYGWIPVCSKREALHQLLFSQGVIMRKSENGDILFTVPTTRYYNEIPSSQIYNEGSEEYAEHTNSVVVTEHSFPYDENDSSESLYKAEDENAESAIIKFRSAPVYYNHQSLSYDQAHNDLASGIYRMCFYAGNCNAAIVGKVRKQVLAEEDEACIKGSSFSDEEKSIIRQVGDYPDGKDVYVSNATLVTSQNSEAVADRMESYYGNAYTIKNSIVLSGENNGGYYNFMSPFKDNVFGFLKKQTLSFSSNIKANCEFVVNYNPPTLIETYSNYVILTGSGTWQVPESVYESDNPRIKIVLIGGGQGGESGYAGANGESASVGASSSEPAEGGAPGMPGKGGLVYQITLNNPPTSFTYSTGQGGAGGAICTSHTTNNQGQLGGETTISDGVTTYSSEDGAVLRTGYLNLIANEVYALSDFKFYKWGYYSETQIPMQGGVFKITDGYGGDGGYFGTTTYPGETAQRILTLPAKDATYYYGLGQDDYVVFGKKGGYGLSYPRSGSITKQAGMPGGGGIGEKDTTTANGGDGGDATSSKAGNGGKGGDATWIPPKATDFNPKYYGYGGHGGGGGGGGGSSGWLQSGTKGTGGAGGYGGVGGAGGDGCILIYY